SDAGAKRGRDAPPGRPHRMALGSAADGSASRPYPVVPRRIQTTTPRPIPPCYSEPIQIRRPFVRNRRPLAARPIHVEARFGVSDSLGMEPSPRFEPEMLEARACFY